MNIAPTIEGGLRIDPENPKDWHILRAIVIDATQSHNDLASRLGAVITDERLSEDWNDIIVPDLRESFSDDLHHIQAAIETAAAFPKDKRSSIWVTREDAMQWYSALNQARLALEDTHRFSTSPDPDPKNLVRFEAYLRSQFYCAFQSLLLRHAITL